jgi:hypothetical protein
VYFSFNVHKAHALTALTSWFKKLIAAFANVIPYFRIFYLLFLFHYLSPKLSTAIPDVVETMPAEGVVEGDVVE